jgi:hypothetical protein
MTAIFEPIWELTIVAVGDPGIPNRERVIIRPTAEINLGEYALSMGIRDDDNPNFVRPLNDHIFWFTNTIATPPLWIFVYTGKGSFRETTLEGSDEKALAFHWGRENTIFNFAQLVPVLFRTGGILIGPNPIRPRYLPPLPPPAPASKRPAPLAVPAWAKHRT